MSNTVNANGGTATIRASQLTGVQNWYMNIHGFYWPSTLDKYYGGFLMVILYNHSIQTLPPKQFAFVKQREYLGVVKFL